MACRGGRGKWAWALVSSGPAEELATVFAAGSPGDARSQWMEHADLIGAIVIKSAMLGRYDETRAGVVGRRTLWSGAVMVVPVRLARCSSSKSNSLMR